MDCHDTILHHDGEIDDGLPSVDHCIGITITGLEISLPNDLDGRRMANAKITDPDAHGSMVMGIGFERVDVATGVVRR